MDGLAASAQPECSGWLRRGTELESALQNCFWRGDNLEESDPWMARAPVPSPLLQTPATTLSVGGPAHPSWRWARRNFRVPHSTSGLWSHSGLGHPVGPVSRERALPPSYFLGNPSTLQRLNSTRCRCHLPTPEPFRFVVVAPTSPSTSTSTTTSPPPYPLPSLPPPFRPSIRP